VLATDTVVGGRYVLGPLLGHGGVADVYRAHDLTCDEPVAVKILRHASTNDLRRFEREARALERLHHPAIVRLRDEGEHDGVPFLVLDLVDGQPLSRVLKSRRFDDAEVASIGAALADALAHAHALGVVHRDVKPGNVLLDEHDGVHLTDFGIAQLTDGSATASITDTGFVVGTAAYLSPEQVQGQPAEPASDVYSLGLVLIEAASGERPFEGSPVEVALARLERPPTVPDVAPWLAALLTAMTAVEPADRPPASTVAAALAARDGDATATSVLPVAGEATTAIPVPVAATRSAATRSPTSATTRRRLSPAAVVALAVAAIVLFAFAMYANAGTGATPANAGTTTVPAPPPPSSTTVPTTVAVTTPAAPAPTAKPAPHHKDRKG